MRFAVIAALSAAALANPLPMPQEADDFMGAYEDSAADIAAPTPVPVNAAPSIVAIDTSSVASAAIADATSGGINKRDHVYCGAYAPGNGPAITSPADDDSSFLAASYFSQAANAASTPSGYHAVHTNLQSAITAGSYMGYDELTSYDIGHCSSTCTTTPGCVSFNIYFERDPTVEASPNGGACPNPASTTRIKCSYWGVPVTTADATNDGQYQGGFHVVIAGSNSYSNVPDTPSGFTPPMWLRNAAIMSPTADNTYMGVQTFPNAAYDPSVCASACQAKSAYNVKHAAAGTTPRICRFFDAYMLYKNGKNGLFTCAYYTQAYDASYAKNVGQYNKAGDHYTIDSSYTFTLSSTSSSAAA